MRLYATVLSALFAASIYAGGCTKSTTPDLRKTVPKVPNAPVAAGAVAAAAALALANPSLAGQQKEDPTAPRNMRFKKSDEQVSAGVLDRLEAQETSSEASVEPDCVEPEPNEPTNDDKAKNADLELTSEKLDSILVEGGTSADSAKQKPKCRKPDDSEPPGDETPEPPASDGVPAEPPPGDAPTAEQ